MAIDVTRYACQHHVADPGFEFYGLQAAEELGYGPGSIYPALRRLERAGWLLRREEDSREPRETGRPPRTYFRVNPDNLAPSARALPNWTPVLARRRTLPRPRTTLCP